MKSTKVSAVNDVDDNDEALNASSKALYKTLNPSGSEEIELEELLHNISKARGQYISLINVCNKLNFCKM